MKSLLFRLQLPAQVLATGAACIVLHEFGHALDGWATGARLAEFDLLSLRPHVRLTGPGDPTALAIRASAGSFVLLGAWLMTTLLVPRPKLRHPVLHTISFFAGIELLGWFLSALAHPFNTSKTTPDISLLSPAFPPSSQH